MQKLKKWATDKRLFSGVMVFMLILSTFIPYVAGIALIYFVIFMLTLDKVGDESRVKRQLDLEYRRLDVLMNDIKELKEEQDRLEFDVKMRDFALYTPKFNFVTALGYKDALTNVRDEQKALIDKKMAVSFSDTWTVNGSLEEGARMTERNIRQILRIFNIECDFLVSRVNHENVETIEDEMWDTMRELNEVFSPQHIALLPQYCELKVKELYTAFEYELQKEAERAAIREANHMAELEYDAVAGIQNRKAALISEIDTLKEKSERLEVLIPEMDDSKVVQAERRRGEMLRKIESNKALIERLEYLESHVNAGYVYIAGNPGAFGEGVFRIGVTRQLDPIEGVLNESTGRLPFDYDVHMVAFSANAVDTAAAVRNAFKRNRLNLIDDTSEFFDAPLSEMERELMNQPGVSIEFVNTKHRSDYNQTIKLKQQTG